MSVKWEEGKMSKGNIKIRKSPYHLPMSVKILLFLFRQYQRFFSPDHSLWAKAMNRPPYCRYYPSCSDYAVQAITEYGSIKGSWLATKRIARCHPWSKGGYDPIPKK